MQVRRAAHLRIAANSTRGAGLVGEPTRWLGTADAAVAGMTVARLHQHSPEHRVRALIDDWKDAIRSKDIERLMACYAPDVVAFDMMAPLEWRGADSYRDAWAEGLAMPGEYEIELYEPMITANDQLAFAVSLARYDVRPPDAAAYGGWFRWTANFMAISDVWKIVHEHSSVPIEFASRKALLDLRP